MATRTVKRTTKSSKKAVQLPAKLIREYSRMDAKTRESLISMAEFLTSYKAEPAPAAEPAPDVNQMSYQDLRETDCDLAKLTPDRAREFVCKTVRNLYDNSLRIGLHAGILRLQANDELPDMIHRGTSEWACPEDIDNLVNKLINDLDFLGDLLHVDQIEGAKKKDEQLGQAAEVDHA